MPSAITLLISQSGKPPGTPGQSRDDLDLATFTVEDTANLGAGTHIWEYVPPEGESVVPTGLTTNQITITNPTKRGTWKFRKTFTDGTGTAISTLLQGGAGIKYLDGTRQPATGETTQFGGWHKTMDTMLRLRSRGQVAPGNSVFLAAAEHPGETITLLPGSHTLDADITSVDVVMEFKQGAVLLIATARTLNCKLGFRAGSGVIRPSSGVAASILGTLNLSHNHFAFDPSLGGLFIFGRTVVSELTPYNFGGKGDNVTWDDLAMRALLAASISASTTSFSGVPMFIPAGRYVIGRIMDLDSRGDFVQSLFTATASRMYGSGPSVSDFKFNPAPAWTASTAYALSSVVANVGNLYKATTAGTSASSGGPTGTGSGITDGTVVWNYVAADNGAKAFYCHRVEEQPYTKPTLNTYIENLRYAANGDTTRRKIALDIHDGRRMLLHKITIENWSDTSSSSGRGSIGLRIRGRDSLLVDFPFIDADTPILLEQNDDENAPLGANGLPQAWRDTSHKDVDHIEIRSPTLASNNVNGACVLIGPGTVFRNVVIWGDFAFVFGGVHCVDRLDSGGVAYAGAAVKPLRTSNGLRIAGNGRWEGLSAGQWAVWIDRHQDAPLQELEIDGPLIAEGYDARRHALNFANFTFTADHTTDTFTKTAHGLYLFQDPVRLTTTGTLPAGLNLATDYWPIPVTADTYKLASSYVNAIAGTAVAISDNGTGVHTLTRSSAAALSGAPWNGVRAFGVRRVIIKSGTRYSGAGIPLEVDSGCDLVLEPGARMIPSDLGRYYPEHSSHFTFIRDRLGFDALQAYNHWYQLNEDQGANAVDFAGVYDLQAGTNQPTYRQLVARSNRYWIAFTKVANQKLRFNSTAAALDAQLHSKMFDAVIKFDDTPPATFVDVMNLTGDANGLRLRMNTSGKLVLRSNGTDSTDVSDNVFSGKICKISVAHNLTASTYKALITTLDGIQEEIAGAFFSTPVHDGNAGLGACSALITSFGGLVTSFACALDGAAEQSLDNLHGAFDWAI